MFIYNCIVNETAAFEWFGAIFYNYILRQHRTIPA